MMQTEMADSKSMSALGQKADIRGRLTDVSFTPKVDINR
jgi:hypothetical protein